MLFRRPSLHMAVQGQENFEKLGLYSQTRLQSQLYHDGYERYQKPSSSLTTGYVLLVHQAGTYRN